MGSPSRPEQDEYPVLGEGSHKKSDDVDEKSPEEFSIDVRPGGKSGQAEAEENEIGGRNLLHQPHCDTLAGEHFQ